MSALKLGEHSTTFSGGPLVCAAGCAAIDTLLEERLTEAAAEKGLYFKTQLQMLMARHNIVKEVRGLGLMLGIELRFDVLGIITRCAEKGVLVLDAGRNVIRFLPPLVITQTQIDKTIAVLDKALEEEEHARANQSSPVSN